MTDFVPQVPSGSEIFISSLTARLSEDGKRVRMGIDLSNVGSRPTLELAVLDGDRNVITHSAILGVMTPHLEFTLHLPSAPPCDLQAGASLLAKDGQELDRKIVPVKP
ncbi:MAG TPA: hypothetical protein PK040_02585 [Anaerolineaceae bacterium]|nr:hypothetical protein [Anaerolineaceae bacterium]